MRTCALCVLECARNTLFSSRSNRHKTIARVRIRQFFAAMQEYGNLYERMPKITTYISAHPFSFVVCGGGASRFVSKHPDINWIFILIRSILNACN